MTIDENFELKGIMKNYLLSQKDVAKIVGVDRSLISKVLSGKRELKPEKNLAGVVINQTQRLLKRLLTLL